MIVEIAASRPAATTVQKVLTSDMLIMAAKKKLRLAPASTLRNADPLLRHPGEPLLPGYLPHHLSRLMNLMNMQLLEFLRPLDITGQQFRVMQVIDARGVTNVGQIARDAVIEQSLVSRVIDQLEERHLAKRSKSATKARVVEVSLTPRGNETYAAITPYREAIVGDAMRVLNNVEKAALDDLLCRIFKHLSRPRTAMAPAQRKR
jgi:DNA-binding MarR family transcriptional regulator